MNVSLNPKYQALFSSKDRYFIVTGGRGSGKSFGVTLFLLSLLFEEGHKVLFTRLTMASAHTSIIPEFVDKLELMGVLDQFRVTRDEIRHTDTGSSIIFKGIKTSSGNQTAALKSLQGVTTFVVEEAEELVDESVFDKIDLSVRVKNKQNRCILILNPSTKNHWVYQRWFRRETEDGFIHICDEGYNGSINGATYIHTTYLDNKDNLPDSFMDNVKRMMREQPEKYEHVMLGGWLERADGVIYTNWVKGRFNEDAPQMCWGQDFGFSSTDPTTLVKVAVDKKKRTIWVKEGYVKTGLTTSQIATLNRSKAGNDLIVADNHEPRLITELRSYGLTIKPAIQKSGSILSGISLIQDYKIVVDPSSTNIIKELNNYAWKDTGVQAKPKGGFDHCLDAIRYAVWRLVGRSNGIYMVR